MFDTDNNKDYCKDDYTKERKNEETCVEINIFCEDEKKSPLFLLYLS